MSKYNVGSKGTQSGRISGTAPKKTPRCYQTHPGEDKTRRYNLGNARVVKGTRREGVGAYNKDLKMKA